MRPVFAFDMAAVDQYPRYEAWQFIDSDHDSIGGRRFRSLFYRASRTFSVIFETNLNSSKAHNFNNESYELKIMKEVLLNALERMGMAWWVEVKTDLPHCTYYFGPFLNRQEAIEHQSGYIEDLQNEGAQNICVQTLRCTPAQLTIGDLEPMLFQPSVNAA